MFEVVLIGGPDITVTYGPYEKESTAKRVATLKQNRMSDDGKARGLDYIYREIGTPEDAPEVTPELEPEVRPHAVILEIPVMDESYRQQWRIAHVGTWDTQDAALEAARKLNRDRETPGAYSVIDVCDLEEFYGDVVEEEPEPEPIKSAIPDNLIHMMKSAHSKTARDMWIRICTRNYGRKAVETALNIKGN